MTSSSKTDTSSLVRSLQQIILECYLFAQLFVYTVLSLVLKLPQKNCGASTYFHGALMLAAYLLQHVHCKFIEKFKAS